MYATSNSTSGNIYVFLTNFPGETLTILVAMPLTRPYVNLCLISGVWVEHLLTDLASTRGGMRGAIAVLHHIVTNAFAQKIYAFDFGAIGDTSRVGWTGMLALKI